MNATNLALLRAGKMRNNKDVPLRSFAQPRSAEPGANQVHRGSAADGAAGKPARTGMRRNAGITSSRALVTRVAEVTRELRDQLRDALADPQIGGAIRELRRTFERLLTSELSDGDFADVIAQLLVCSLLTARLDPSKCPDSDAEDLWIPAHPIVRQLLESLLPVTGTLPRECTRQRAKRTAAGSGTLPRELQRSDLPVAPSPLLRPLHAMLSQTDREAVLRDFHKRHPGEDPILHFYERFLQQYDAGRRRAHGVFFTPHAVVTHVVHSVHEVLQTEFGIADGLASGMTWGQWLERQEGQLPPGVDRDAPFVTILDPAAGTGAFLVEVIEVVHVTLQQKWAGRGWGPAERQAAWNAYVPRHLLPRLFGYELLPAPYAMAHLQIERKLRETGYDFDGQLHARVYLTNALEPPGDGDFPQCLWSSAPALADEVRAAAAVKCRQRFTVVLGNPPYAGMSRNSNGWIRGLLRGQAGGGRKWEDYYQAEGVPLAERKVWLQDDYVKFLRYGHWLIEQSGCGILGYVTNHGYLDNPTFRGLRESLRATFSGMAITDLHGSAKKSDGCPEGGPDENVFDIESGVAIGMFWRAPGAGRSDMGHADLWGTREDKRRVLGETTALRLAARRIEPRPPWHLFRPFDASHGPEYEGGWKLTEVMPVHGTGLVTARDHFVIARDRQALLDRIDVFRSALPDEQVRARFFTGRTRSPKYLPGDTRGWRLIEARQRVRDDPGWRQRPRLCLYRPFDTRWVYYTGAMVDWPRRALMRHMLAGANLGLIARRQMPGRYVTYFFATDRMISDGVIRSDNKGSETLFPLYLIPAEPDRSGAPSPVANLNPDFVQALSEAVGLEWLTHCRGDLHATFGPEDVLHFIYAQFFSPLYRERFAEWLRIDFPRLFLPASRSLFQTLCTCGNRLIRLHRSPPDGDRASSCEPPSGERPPSQLIGEGPLAVADGFPQFRNGSVYLNPARRFTPVPETVWSFRIGAYPVCQKWLKDRRGQPLSPDDLHDYARIVAAVADSLRQMQEIDQAIQRHGGWSTAFQAVRRQEPDKQP